MTSYCPQLASTAMKRRTREQDDMYQGVALTQRTTTLNRSLIAERNAAAAAQTAYEEEQRKMEDSGKRSRRGETPITRVTARPAFHWVISAAFRFVSGAVGELMTVDAACWIFFSRQSPPSDRFAIRVINTPNGSTLRPPSFSAARELVDEPPSLVVNRSNAFGSTPVVTRTIP
jgi:hypothetical protein